MGINRPSLYAAFGNKEQLFRKALDRYQRGPMSFLTEALREPTARAVVEAIFSGFVRMQRDRDIAQGAWSCPGHSRAARRSRDSAPGVSSIEASDRNGVTEALERAVQDDDLPGGTDCSTLARYTATVLSGLAVQAASRGDREGVVAGFGAGNESMAVLTRAPPGGGILSGLYFFLCFSTALR